MIEENKTEITLSQINKLVNKNISGFINKKDRKQGERFRCIMDVLNIALSGNPRKGILRKGITCLAGSSGTYKTNTAVLMAKSFIKKYPHGKIMFFDSEDGCPEGFFEAYRIPDENVDYKAFDSIEELTQILVQFTHNLNEDEELKKIPFMFIIDSLSFATTKKNIENLLESAEKIDMTKAKKINEFITNILRPLNRLEIPMILIAHTYKEQTLFPKDVVKGGKGLEYGSNDILMFSRVKNKDSGEIFEGAVDFKIRIEKSRFVKREKVFNITMSDDDGLLRFSGLFEIALELGIFEKVGNFFKIPNDETYGKFTKKSTIKDGNFWKYVYDNTDFIKRCEEHFILGFKPFDLDDDFDIEHF